MRETSQEYLHLLEWCGDNSDLCHGKLKDEITHLQHLAFADAGGWSGSNVGAAAAGVLFIGGIVASAAAGGGSGPSGGDENFVYRSFAEPESLVGASLEEVSAMVPDGWIPEAVGKGFGVKWLAPGKIPGARGSISYEISPQVSDPLHSQGFYTKVAVGGMHYRAAGADHGVLNDESVENLRVESLGSSGNPELSRVFQFEIQDPSGSAPLSGGVGTPGLSGLDDPSDEPLDAGGGGGAGE